MSSFLIFDIETVPDLSLWTPPLPEAPPPDPSAPLPGQAPLALPGAPAPPNLQSVPPSGAINLPTQPAPGFTIQIPPAGQPKKRKPRAKKALANGEPAKEPFAPLYAHRVIAIGWTWMDLPTQGAPALRGLGCVGTSQFKDDESALLTAWNEFVKREQPTVVTFCGRTFEVPVLGLRALRHGISQSWADEAYRKRYSDHHVDLFDVITEYGALPRTGYSLGTLSTILGLPDKGEVSGGSVNAMYQRGEIAKIEAYCCSDAVRTAFLLLRYRLMRGWMTVEQYQLGARMLLDAAAANNLGNLTLGVDTKRLLLG